MRIYSFAPAGVKRGIRRPFYAGVIIILLLASISQAQPALLGAADMQASPTRTPSGFLIHGRGFIEWDNDKREAKTTRWLNKHAPGLTTDYTTYTWLLEDHWYLPTMTDEAWERTKARFIACGGRWAQAARSTNPRSIAIYIEAQPFTHPSWPGQLLGGMTDGSVIRVAIAHINGLSTGSLDLVTYSRNFEWEAGNALARRAGYDWTRTGIEIGSNSPCGQ